MPLSLLTPPVPLVLSSVKHPGIRASERLRIAGIATKNEYSGSRYVNNSASEDGAPLNWRQRASNYDIQETWNPGVVICQRRRLAWAWTEVLQRFEPRMDARLTHITWSNIQVPGTRALTRPRTLRVANGVTRRIVTE
jgi:hypothetical protein